MNPKTELNDEEILAVKRFRKRVEDILPQMKNDYLRHELGLIRFLRARNMNLDKAEEMLTQHLAWRRENDIDRILEKETPADFEKDYPVTICGLDKEGNLVILIKFGQWDIRKAVEAGLRNEFVAYITRLFELALEIARDLTTPDKYVTQGVMVVDFEGFEFRQIMSKEVIETILDCLHVFEANYPEILRAAWAINAPKVFQLLWAIIKPILTPRTLAKIHIHGNDKLKWKSTLMEQVQEDNVASEYGGAITTCPQVKFATASVKTLFPKYETFPEESFTTVTIPPGQKRAVEIEVSAGTELAWNFKTKEFDIGFALNYEGCEPILKYCRVDSHIYLQKGKHFCKDDGKYIFIFDNSFSAFRGKSISYVIKAKSNHTKKMADDEHNGPVIDTSP